MPEDEAQLGLGYGSRLPVRMNIGTPSQRQFSTSRRSATYVSVVGAWRDSVDLLVAVVLAADEPGWIGCGIALPERRLPVLDRLRPGAGGGLHGSRRRQLQQVVHDHVSQRADLS
jgi:hypothetical protein